LDGKIHNILTKHHKDYISTFNEFMDSVRKDLKEKIEHMERIEREKRKSESLPLVMTERDFFRQEAIRLNQLCKELSIKIEEMNKRIKIIDNDHFEITNKWKESQIINKQLTYELERNVKLNKELEDNLKNLILNNVVKNNQIKVHSLNFNLHDNTKLSNHVNSTDAHGSSHGYIETNYSNFDKKNLNKFEKKDFQHEDYQSIYNKEKEKYLNIITNLKNKLKKEKIKNNLNIGDLNKTLFEKNALEKIFIDCFEEVKKDIEQRKLKDNLNKKTNFTGFITNYHWKNKETIPVVNNIKFDNFLLTDKKRLIENFLENDEIIKFVRELVFRGNFNKKNDKQKNYNMDRISNLSFSGKSNQKNISSLKILLNSNRPKNPNFL